MARNTPRYECQNCGTLWAKMELDEVEDLASRVEPGERVPDGQCPDTDCKALCHLMEYAIEFRNGGYFQNLESQNSGPLRTAMRFNSKRLANLFMKKHSWILVNGGMAVQL